MSEAYRGGCACGAIRYTTTSTPVVESHCQCRECQRVSGTGHSSYLVFADRDAMTIDGQASIWRVAGDSGQEKSHAFCPDCGAPVYLTFSRMPDLVAVHAASLDDPGRFNPAMVTYTVRGHSWDTLDPALQAFAKMPTG